MKTREELDPRTHPSFDPSAKSFTVNGRWVVFSSRHIDSLIDGWNFYVEGCPHRLILTGESITQHVLLLKGPVNYQGLMDEWCARLIARHLKKCDLEALDEQR